MSSYLGSLAGRQLSVDEKPDVIKYEYGSRGPKGLDEYVAKYGYKNASAD